MRAHVANARVLPMIQRIARSRTMHTRRLRGRCATQRSVMRNAARRRGDRTRAMRGLEEHCIRKATSCNFAILSSTSGIAPLVYETRARNAVNANQTQAARRDRSDRPASWVTRGIHTGRASMGTASHRRRLATRAYARRRMLKRLNGRTVPIG